MMNRAPAMLAPCPLDQPCRRQRRSAGRQQIIDDQHARAGRAGVDMHRQPVGAIFERIILGDGRAGQLAVLADQQQARAQLDRQRAADGKAARLDRRDQVDRPVDRGRQRVDRAGEAARGRAARW